MKDDTVATFTNPATGESSTLNSKDLRNAVSQAKKVVEEQPESTRDRIITKIKLTSEQNTIQYTRSTDNHEPENCSVQFYGSIHPDFETVLNSLIGIAIDVIGLDDELWKDGFVSGVSIKHDGEMMGCTITAQRRAEEGKAIIVNTPYLKPEDMTREQVLLESLCREALACTDGKRAQGNLFGN